MRNIRYTYATIGSLIDGKEQRENAFYALQNRVYNTRDQLHPWLAAWLAGWLASKVQVIKRRIGQFVTIIELDTHK